MDPMGSLGCFVAWEGKRRKEVWLEQGLGGLLCRRGTDLLCYFNLIQILTHNLGLMVRLLWCCCGCKHLQEGESVSVCSTLP